MNLEVFDTEKWQALVDLLAKIMGVTTAGITRYEPPHIRVLATSMGGGNPVEAGLQAPADSMYCGVVIQKKKELFVPNAHQDPRWAGKPLVEMGLISYMGMPLLLPGGEVFGTLCVLDNKENHFSDVFRELLFQIKGFVEAQLKLTCRKNQVVQRNLDLELIQENLIDISQDLKTKNEDLEDFVNFVSHDLKEPLRKIKFFGGKVRTADNEATREELLDRVMNAVGRMEQLIDSFLELSQVDAQPLRYAPTDLNEVIAEVLEGLETNHNGEKILFEKEPLPLIEANRPQMYQLFLNLLSNAVKFRSENRPCEIRISSFRLPNGLHEIRVHDNGRGFEMKYAYKVFEPLKRLNSPSKKEGAGLGLAIAKKVVEHHNGSIRAESIPNKGTTFFVALPLSQTTDSDF